jgi:hypothetical protein
MTVTSVVQTDLDERVGGCFHAELVAEVEYWMVSGGAEGDPRAPPQRRQKRVGRVVVVTERGGNEKSGGDEANKIHFVGLQATSQRHSIFVAFEFTLAFTDMIH